MQCAESSKSVDFCIETSIRLTSACMKYEAKVPCSWNSVGGQQYVHTVCLPTLAKFRDEWMRGHMLKKWISMWTSRGTSYVFAICHHHYHSVYSGIRGFNNFLTINFEYSWIISQDKFAEYWHPSLPVSDNNYEFLASTGSTIGL